MKSIFRFNTARTGTLKECRWIIDPKNPAPWQSLCFLNRGERGATPAAVTGKVGIFTVALVALHDAGLAKGGTVLPPSSVATPPLAVDDASRSSRGTPTADGKQRSKAGQASTLPRWRSA